MQNDKAVDIGANIKWTGSKWSLGVTNLTSGNTVCNVAFTTAKMLKELILADNEVKTPITIPGQEPSAYKESDVTGTGNRGVSASGQGYYVTYGTGWKANGTKFDLTGATVTSGTFKNSYSSLVGKYIPSINEGKFLSSTAGTKLTTTGLSTIYYVVSATATSFVYKEIGSNKNTNEALLASTPDDYGTSYYFRGSVENNYVEFANMCWRIVRITGSGDIKLVLYNHNGLTSSTSTPLDTNPCAAVTGNNKAFVTRPGTEYFTTLYANDTGQPEYVGFMYEKYTNENVININNTNKSRALETLENWYNNILIKQSGFNDSKLADTIWCNDRNYTLEDSDVDFRAKSDGPDIDNQVNFAPYTRTNQPTLICANDTNGGKANKFTVSDTTNGNGDLDVKVGLLTKDEAAFAGAGVNPKYYLYNNCGTTWWTMSPAVYTSLGQTSVFAIEYSGEIIINPVAVTGAGVRPSIALTSTIRATGSGTSTDPYVIR